MDIDWNSHFQDNSIHECWGKLLQKLEEAVRKHIPTKTIHPDARTRPLWMNKEVSTKVILKQRAWRKYSATRSSEDHKIYAKFRNQVRWQSRKATKNFEKLIAQEAKDNPKSFWAYINSKLKTKSGIAELEQPDGSLASKDIDKAEVLNNFFSGVFTREDINTLPLVQKCKLMKDFPEVLFTPDIVKKSWKNSKQANHLDLTEYIQKY